jgi:hypothetical protein
VPCLAIEQDLRTAEVTLLYCDRDWEVVAVHSGISVGRAKARAERMYPGSRSYWKRRNVTVQQVLEHLQHRWDGYQCSFCKRTPEEFDRVFENGPARICNRCVAEFADEGTNRQPGS